MGWSLGKLYVLLIIHVSLFGILFFSVYLFRGFDDRIPVMVYQFLVIAYFFFYLKGKQKQHCSPRNCPFSGLDLEAYILCLLVVFYVIVVLFYLKAYM